MAASRSFLLIALALAAMAGAARLAESTAVSRLAASGEQAGVVAAEAAVDRVASGVRALEADLIARANRVAGMEAVRAALRDPALAGEAIAAFERLRVPEGYAIELYSPMPEVIAWRGPSLPFDPATRRLTFLDTTQSAVVRDGGVRQALVVWQPIREDRRVIGAVRVARILSMQVPVRNEYLQDFDLIAEWARGAVPPVMVAFEAPGQEPPAGAVSRRVYGIDGQPLATLIADPPPAEVVMTGTRHAHRRVVSFFFALLLAWLVAGLGGLARSQLTRASITRHRHQAARALAAGLAFVGALWGLRYALLALGMPARYVTGPTPAALDPAFLGSGAGGGLAGSAAELAITAAFAGLTAGAIVYAGLSVVVERRARARVDGDPALRASGVGGALAAAAIGVAALVGAAFLVHRATEDATLGYFDRAGPLPEGLVLLAFGAFLVLMLAAAGVLVGLTLLAGLRGGQRIAVASGATLLAMGIAYALGAGAILPPIVGVGMIALAGSVALWLTREPERWPVIFGLRGAIGAAVLVTLLTYPVVLDALAAKEEARLREAIEDFADGEDPRVAFALESVLLDARGSDVVRTALARSASGDTLRAGLADSLAADLVTGSLLAALADYRVGLMLHDSDGRPLGRFIEELPPRSFADVPRTTPAPPDPFGFARLHRLYEAEAEFVGFAVERRPTGDRAGKFRYAGIGPVRVGDPADPPVGWITARAEPRPARYVSETPFPRVLVPAGLYPLADEEWVLAEFADGVLQRSRGADFGRFRLPTAIRDLPEGEARWRTERLEGQLVRVYYRRIAADRVVAARVPATTVFDHLYSILRILTPGLLLALLAYAGGIRIRRSSAGAYRPRLRDRVLNRFLLVGLLAVVATGMIGREVIVVQNREAVEERLKRQLARLEAALYDDVAGAASGDAIPPARILDRARVDQVGPRVGLDVNLYRGAELVASSRSQLVRQRLIEPRLPVEVVRALFVDGQRYAFATERMGRFTFTTGFEAIPDEEGRPAVVIAVPTLPEQAAIEADQARMVAYLFGVLLLLLLMIFGIATVLANRLTQPFRRLREGLRAVGAGEAPAEPIPVERRDEVGEVIETFNAVWDQLEDSRRRLATQERELAWREMARQVAHEIKNPLTPMRLSVQHLRRAHDRAATEPATEERYNELFSRVSSTLLEQIDALNRIAGEFSRFGRLPESSLETFDLNEVLRQAAALVAEEPRAEIIMDIADEPLFVRADREELRRAYINLLKNAQQAIPEGEHGVITVCSERREGTDGPAGATAWAYSEVRDTGAGIPEDVQPRIFQPNFSTKTSGMGLGLAITRKTVDDLDGDISFETAPGRGTSFIIRLPLALTPTGAGK